MNFKELFSKENFLFPTFEKKQKIQSFVLAGIIGVLFVFCAFAFLNVLYCFADAVGSIVSGSADVAAQDIGRSFPFFLCLFMGIWSLLLAQAFFRNVDEDKRRRSLYKNAIAILVFAGINIIYVFANRFSGRYLSLVEGSPLPLYPLDTIICSLVFAALAACAIVYEKKLKDKLPYVVPNRAPVVKKARFIYCFAISLWMLVSFFSFAAFWMGLFIIDFKHGYAAYSIALLTVFLVNFCFFTVWEFYYNELKEESRKKVLLPLAIIALGVAAVAAIFYFVALGFNLDGPANVGFGVLPVAFSASVNIATMGVVFTPLIVGITALIKGLIIRKK